MKTFKEKKLEEFNKFIEPAINKGFDDGEFTQKSYRDRYAWQLDLRDFLSQALDEQEQLIREKIWPKVPEDCDEYSFRRGINDFLASLSDNSK